MKLDFTKMHGLGNDFVIINGLHKSISLTSEQIRALADRYTGIGFDQLVILQPATRSDADVMYRVFNADGGEGGQSGNGARCVARYLREKSIINSDEISAQTIKGLVHFYFEKDDAVRVNMGAPGFEPKDIPLVSTQRQSIYPVELADRIVEVHSLSMGNPHAVIMVPDIATAEVEKISKQLQQHPVFPQSVNVGFLQIVDRSHVLLRVYERGAGETLACGTGSCAAVVAGIMDKKLDSVVTVGLARGSLVIKWEGEGSDVWMTGPATTVFEGQITL
jgi:diaminopimelate epimerase